MSKLTRQSMLWFGSTSDSSSVGVFGSLKAGSPTYSKVIATIQGLGAWGSGWKAEVVSPDRPALQDFNAVDYVFSYGICYLHQMGIPEWDTGTVYYTNSYCQVAGQLYQSLQDDNVGQDPTTATSYWQVLQYVSLTGNQTVAGIKTFSSFPVTPSTAPTTNYQVANKKYVDDSLSTGSSGARAYAAGSQTISSGVIDTVTLGTENYDIGGNFAGSTFTVPTTGYYFISGSVTFAPPDNCTLYLYAYIYKGSSAIITHNQHYDNPGAQVHDQLSMSDIYYLTAGDAITLRANMGGAASVGTVAGSDATFLTVMRIK